MVGFFKIFGMNALFAFVFHVILLKLQYTFKITTSDGSKMALISYIKDYFLGDSVITMRHCSILSVFFL